MAPPLAGSTGPLAHAIRHIASRAYWHGPARLRAVYGVAPALLTTAAASGCLHARGLLVDPASAFTAGRHWQTQRAPALRASCALPVGHDIAVLPHAVEVAILYAPHVVASPNVAVSHQPCGCGRTHAFVKALTAILQGALLSAYTTQYPFDTIYVQFDGGCHTGPQVGGAGVAIWQGALLGPAHVSVSQPLCVCVDSYEAEAEASVIAVVRAFEFVQALRGKGLAIQRVHFQGDNLAVVAYLAGYGRLRRPGLVARFQSAWDTLARSHVCTTWEQVPRSANTVADRLAGDALRPSNSRRTSLYTVMFRCMMRLRLSCRRGYLLPLPFWLPSILLHVLGRQCNLKSLCANWQGLRWLLPCRSPSHCTSPL